MSLLRDPPDRVDVNYYVGVAGRTGAGKSCLIGALLGLPDDVAPISQSQTCTATPCYLPESPTPPGNRLCYDFLQIEGKSEPGARHVF